MRRLVVGCLLAACLLNLLAATSASLDSGSPSSSGANRRTDGTNTDRRGSPAPSSSPTAAFHLGDNRGTQDPDVEREVHDLLSQTEYAGVTVHFMPQTVVDPDCHVVTFEEKRHGGRCSRMAGGMPFCAVKNYVFPNHPDCVDMEADSSAERPWASPQWFVRMATPDIETTTEHTEDPEDTTAADPTPPPPGGGRVQLTDPLLPLSQVNPPEIRPTEGARASRRRGEGRRRRPVSLDDQGK